MIPDALITFQELAQLPVAFPEREWIFRTRVDASLKVTLMRSPGFSLRHSGLGVEVDTGVTGCSGDEICVVGIITEWELEDNGVAEKGTG